MTNATRKTSVGRRAFTLVELLVTISIFVIVLAMAVPVFRTLTGSRSVAAATNIISATLGRVRTDAVNYQDHRGILFYLDQNTGRIAMASLVEVPIGAGTWSGGVLYKADLLFDLDATVDPVLLPPGVGLETVINATFGGGVRTSNGYLGFNQVVGATGLPTGGLIVFNPDGTLFVGSVGLAIKDTSGTLTNLAGLLQTGTPGWNYYSYNLYVNPSVQLGFVLFDADPYLSQFGGNAAWADSTVSYASTEKPKEDWLDQNATPFLINRYNGTLIKGE